MRIIGFTIMTDPDYRQDPARESIRQALEVFDEVIVVYGRKEDAEIIQEINSQRLHGFYMHWPQPEWCFDELPKHLNYALLEARGRGASWAVRFDTDQFFHEKDKNEIRQKLIFNRERMIGLFEKMQFYVPSKAYEKGKMKMAINLMHPIWFGQDETKYTDLCQPILWDPEDDEAEIMRVHDMASTEGWVPIGKPVPDSRMFSTRIHVYNYDYTFKTRERSEELLYHFELAHEKFWGFGMFHKQRGSITKESTINRFLHMVYGRIKKSYKTFSINDHPKHIQKKIENITRDQFGYDLWATMKNTSVSS